MAHNIQTPDYLVRGMSTDGAFRVACVSTSHLSNTIGTLQQTDPTASVALGRLISAAGLMVSQLKDGQRLALSIEGNGPLKKLHAEATASGQICASIKQPRSGIPPRNNRFDVAAAIGRAGFLRIIKDLGLKEPYTGMVQLCTSEIGDDLAQYFVESEQTPTCVGLGVLLDKNADIQVSGGFMLQAMPDSDPEAIAVVEERIQNLPTISTMLAAGTTPEEILQQILPAQQLHLYPPTQLVFKCHCSKAGVIRMLAAMDEDSLQQMEQENRDIEVCCEYCRIRYTFSPAEITQIIKANREKTFSA